ncbi:MAG: hypothetical protein CBD16_02860 [Betaproteobacteria bacterium TMED156]|nr:MAG: hypothetical protein CBD16_02860 [Betaproteobacteria bacterium TMED156]
MELKRIVAQDLRAATQEAVRLYGPTTLVVSSERINGKMEIIAAVDIKPEPGIDGLMPEKKDENSSENRLLSEEIAGESFESILSESLEKKKTIHKQSEDKSIEKRDLMNSFDNKIKNTSVRSHNTNKQIVGAKSKEPKFNIDKFSTSIKPIKIDESDIKVSHVNKARGSQKDTEIENFMIEKDKIDNETLRAREIVDLVLREFSDMKKEFKLAQKVALYNTASRLPIEVKGVVDSLNSANMPAGLKTLLIEGIADCSSVEEAKKALSNQLTNTVNSKIKIADELPDKGIHVFSGPTGAGKTSMLLKIISSATQNGVSEENIAVISYKDTRLGAWSQTQISCAQVGVESFKVKDEDFLKTLCEELGGKTLILIDTAGVGSEKNLVEIKSSLQSVKFHLVLPSDSTYTSFENASLFDDYEFSSIYISKFDESVAPWGLLQSIINSNLVFGRFWGTGPSSFEYEPFDKDLLVENALKTLIISETHQVLINEESNKMVFDSFKGFTSEGMQ